MDMPRPVPPYTERAPAFSCVKGSNIRCWNSSLMPMPVSAQTKQICTLSPVQLSSKQSSITRPFSRLYLMALLSTFISSRLTCSGLPTSRGCGSLPYSRCSTIPRSSACFSSTSVISCISSGRSKGTFSSTTSPDSSLPISSTSFTSSSSRVEASQIFLRQSACRAISSGQRSPISTIPRMPLMGVRISWLMRCKNSVLARFALSAFSAAALRVSWYSCSRRSCCSR